MVVWINVHRVAEICGVKILTVYQWKKRNQGPPYYSLPNGRYRWVEEEVEQWLQESRRNPQK